MGAFIETYPISFRVLNEKREEKIYLENKPSNALLEISNRSGMDLKFFSRDGSVDAGSGNFHFALKFRPGILKIDVKKAVKNTLIKKGWMATIENDAAEANSSVAGYRVIYFRYNGNDLFKKTGDDTGNDTILLPLKQLTLDCAAGTTVTQVELICNNIMIDGDENRILNTAIKHFELTVVNHLGNPLMPLHVGFINTNTVLNDDSSQTLILRVNNLLKRTATSAGAITLSHKKKSKIYIYFNVDEERSDYAISKKDDVENIEIACGMPEQNIDDGYLECIPFVEGDTPVWEILPVDGDVVLQPHLAKLSPYHELKSKLSGIVKRVDIIKTGPGIYYKKDDLLVELENENPYLDQLTYFNLRSDRLVNRVKDYIEDIIKVIDIIDQGETTGVLNPVPASELRGIMKDYEKRWFRKAELEDDLSHSGIKDGEMSVGFIKMQIELEELYKTLEDYRIRIGLQEALSNDLNYANTRLYLLKLLSNEPYNVINTGVSAIGKRFNELASIKADLDIQINKINRQLEDYYAACIHTSSFDCESISYYVKEGDAVVKGQTLALLKKKKVYSGYNLPDDSCLDIILSGIKTGYPNGTTFLYLRFENIPGYWDHTYAVPILKQPLVFKEEKVGIGNAKPLGPLAIGNSAHADSDGFIVIGKNNKDGSRHFRIGFDELFNFKIGDYGNNNLAAEWSSPFAIAWNAPGSSFYIRDNGNVGIGTLSPEEKLEINGNIKFTDNGQIASRDNNHRILFRRSENKLELREFGDIIFSPGSTSGTETSKMIFKSTGNVGIGTNSPGEKLEINGNIKFSDNGQITSLDNNHRILFRRSENKLELREFGDIIFSPGSTSGNETSKMIINSAGNVGIGTTNPVVPLEVKGLGYLNYVPSAMDGWLPGNKKPGTGTQYISIKSEFYVMAYGFITTSDRRMKKDFHPGVNKDDLEKINQLEVTDFRYIDQKQVGTAIKKGLIAQQVEQVYPPAVRETVGFIPDVYTLASKVIENSDRLLISLPKPHLLKDGDEVRFFTEDHSFEAAVNIVNEISFSIKNPGMPVNGIFVYGKKVNDFKTLDYDEIFMVGISAIQELSKQVETLKAETQKLKAEQTEMKKDVAAIKEMMGMKLGISIHA